MYLLLPFDPESSVSLDLGFLAETDVDRGIYQTFLELAGFAVRELLVAPVHGVGWVSAVRAAHLEVGDAILVAFAYVYDVLEVDRPDGDPHHVVITFRDRHLKKRFQRVHRVTTPLALASGTRWTRARQARKIVLSATHFSELVPTSIAPAIDSPSEPRLAEKCA